MHVGRLISQENTYESTFYCLDTQGYYRNMKSHGCGLLNYNPQQLQNSAYIKLEYKNPKLGESKVNSAFQSLQTISLKGRFPKHKGLQWIHSIQHLLFAFADNSFLLFSSDGPVIACHSVQ